jgi:TolA-binding protein
LFLYQKALSQGRLKIFNEKILSLQQLTDKFPDSKYQASANYEIGRTFHSNIENADSAIYYYQLFTDKFPNAPQMRTALSSLANLYFNNHSFEKSLETYKTIIAKYPGTNEAVTALEMIKNISVEMNNPDYYVDYVENEGIDTDISEFEKDSLIYESAQKLFVNNDIDGAIAAFDRYLLKYPNGHYSLEANFYQGQCYYSKDMFDNALKAYQFVMAKPSNVFSEDSYLKSSSICFDREDYELALEYYTGLEEVTEQKPRILIARTGMLRSAYLTENYKAVIPAAIKFLETENITDAQIREAHYKLANAYYKTDKINKALSHYSSLSNEVTSFEGGEAKYFVAKINHQMGNDSIAENTIIHFSQQNSPHRYWLAKSFLLLADIYTARAEYFQATHILQSISDNYTDETDGIKEYAREQLMKIRELEEQEAMQDKNQRIPKKEIENTVPLDSIKTPADSIKSQNVEQEIPENNE